MKKKRIIPVLLLRNGWLVQSKGFRRYQNIGNPVTSVQRFSEWASDELVYLDISKNTVYDMRRDDTGHPNRGSLLEIVEDVARQTFMPITIGGGIRTLTDIELRLAKGADKIAINTAAISRPDFIEAAALEFGSQCVVVSIDALRVEGSLTVMADGGKQSTGRAAKDWAAEAESRGAGEILINSVDRDGMKTGYDLELLAQVVDAVRIPVIGLGGVGEWAHFAEALEQTGVDAVAAANIFHYSDQSVYLARKFLYEKGLPVREPALFEIGDSKR
jgi:imidazole glycerol-phosphate synthase subunit HisF